MSPKQVTREDGAGEDSGREGNVVCLMIANSEGVACQLIRGFLATHAPSSSDFFWGPAVAFYKV